MAVLRSPGGHAAFGALLVALLCFHLHIYALDRDRRLLGLFALLHLCAFGANAVGLTFLIVLSSDECLFSTDWFVGLLDVLSLCILVLFCRLLRGQEALLVLLAAFVSLLSVALFVFTTRGCDALHPFLLGSFWVHATLLASCCLYLCLVCLVWCICYATLPPSLRSEVC